MDLAIGVVEDALEWTGFGVRNHLGSKKNWREFPLWGDSPSCVFEIAFFRNVFFCVRATLHFFVFGHFVSGFPSFFCVCTTF